MLASRSSTISAWPVKSPLVFWLLAATCSSSPVADSSVAPNGMLPASSACCDAWMARCIALVSSRVLVVMVGSRLGVERLPAFLEGCWLSIGW
jgi:hypothetical protein